MAPKTSANPHTSNGGSYFCSTKREDIDIYHFAGILSAGDWLRAMPFRDPSKTAAEIDSMWIWKFPIKAFHPKRYIFSRNSGRRIATIHKRGTASKVQVHRNLWFDTYYMFHGIPTSLCLFLKMEKGDLSRNQLQNKRCRRRAVVPNLICGKADCQPLPLLQNKIILFDAKVKKGAVASFLRP